jgi:GTPase SAR1 family protein
LLLKRSIVVLKVIHYCPDVPLILVGTKLDLREDSGTIQKLQALGQTPISTAKGQELANKINAFKYMECSAMTQLGLKDVFDTAVKAVLFGTKANAKKGGCTLL